jgi:hypothetical protein
MDVKDLPKDVKDKLDSLRPVTGPEVLGVVDSSIQCCPDWEYAKDSIYNCLQYLIDEARKVQITINEE